MSCLRIVRCLSALAALLGTPAALAQQPWEAGAGLGDGIQGLEAAGRFRLVVVPGGIVRPEAEARARAMGGHLATIASAAEDAEAFAAANDPAGWFVDRHGNSIGPWLGGWRGTGGGDHAQGWRWVTGEPWAFTARDSGQPDNFGRDETHLNFFALGSGRKPLWNDLSPAAQLNGFVLELAEAAPPPPPAPDATEAFTRDHAVPQVTGPLHWCLACSPLSPGRQLLLQVSVMRESGTLLVRLRDGGDDSGDMAVALRLLGASQRGSRPIGTFRATSMGWEEFRAVIDGPGEYTVLLEDLDTATDGAAPGNGGSLMILVLRLGACPARGRAYARAPQPGGPP